MSEIIVRFSKPTAIVFAIIGVPFFVSMTFICAWMTFSFHNIAQQLPYWKIAVAYVIFPLMTVVSAKATITLIRCGKETLFTTFRFSDGGVKIENKRYGMLTLTWCEVDAALYNRSLRTLVLKSQRLARPVVLMNNASRESPEFHAAVSIIRKSLQSRFSARWI